MEHHDHPECTAERGGHKPDNHHARRGHIDDVDIKVGNIVVADDGFGVNHLSLVGADAASFTILRGLIFLKAGTLLDFETKSSYQVAVAVDDPTNGGSPDATSAIYTLKVGDVSPETTPGNRSAKRSPATAT